MNKYKNNKFTSKQPLIHSAVKKYGWEKMSVTWLAGGPDAPAVEESSLDSLEEEYIQKLNTREPNGYNVQKGGKVAWRGVPGLSRTAPRGPRSEELKQRLRDTWAEKRDERLAGADPEVARAKRVYAAKAQETRIAKNAGTHVDGRFKPSQTRVETWERKREAKLALLPPDQADKERARMERARRNAMASYNKKKEKAVA
jgi:hypothetical protein